MLRNRAPERHSADHERRSSNEWNPKGPAGGNGLLEENFLREPRSLDVVEALFTTEEVFLELVALRLGEFARDVSAQYVVLFNFFAVHASLPYES